jgi:sulfide:quinone oxidoreductase
MSTASPTRVVIVGGGVAGLETAFALRELAGDRCDVELVAPDDDFRYRPQSVREPFAGPRAEHYPLATLAAEAGASLISDKFAWVDAARRVAHTARDVEIPYDALVLAPGARMRPAFAHAITLDDQKMDAQLHGVIQDIEAGYVRSVAFVAPERMGWLLPIYELALMTAARAYDMGTNIDVTVVTPEKAPLAIFGAEVSTAIAECLSDAGITLIASARPQVPEPGQVITGNTACPFSVDRVIALPQLFGPAIRGVRSTSHGFIPVDRFGQVRGVEHIYAAGDATDFEVKHGGLAAQQADTVARTIAARAGADVTVGPVQTEIRGMLLTGRDPRYLAARIVACRGYGSQVTDEPTWDPPAKITAQYLAPYLDELRAAAKIG